VLRETDPQATSWELLLPEEQAATRRAASGYSPSCKRLMPTWTTSASSPPGECWLTGGWAAEVTMELVSLDQPGQLHA
jgi:hypothetical protein